jgi:predicted dithiol-disulfide oxidoreductase (DUF899 family)
MDRVENPPPVVPAEEWEGARQALLAREKAHLRARDTSFALVSRAPLGKLEAFRSRMGWDVPWYSSFESDFNPDFGVGPRQPAVDRHQDGETFGLSVFVREGSRVFRTYFTDRRGVEPLSSNWALLDLTPLGRQEEWEDSPQGRPQSPPYGWWHLHDEYEGQDRRAVGQFEKG